jgi:aryl-alcohol dehydrogenase-like predicted oxidoreductase
MKHRKLGPFQVSPIGLGCMNLSHAYGMPPSVEQGRALLHRALDLDCTLFDTAALYGFGANEKLVGPALKPYRKHITLCSKGGMAGVQFSDGIKRVINGRPEAIRQNCEDSLRNLGTDVIDLYYLHRWDKQVPIEESVGVMSRLVEEGKVRTLGLSEVSATTLRRAHAVHPITALQTEYSLWTRNPEIAVLEACRELGVAFVAFSPLGRGFLPGTLQDVSRLDAKDIRRSMPRFSADSYAANLALLPALQAVADQVGCTLAQLALAWLLQRAENIIPIPGTTSIPHLKENFAASNVTLSAAQMQRLGECLSHNKVQGARYNAATQSEVDTEEF